MTMDIKGKIDSLTDKSIWYFAKQETSFDKIFQACLLIDKYSFYLCTRGKFSIEVQKFEGFQAL